MARARLEAMRLFKYSSLMVFAIAAVCAEADSKGFGWQKLPVEKAAAVEAGIESMREKGRGIYNFHCYYCHGYSGDAKTLASTYLSPSPRDFTSATPRKLGRDRMIGAVSDGIRGTAMASFKNTLSREEIGMVVDFIRDEFMLKKARNTWYHTPENGWENHERYSPAFPFARGEIPLDTPDEKLTPEQISGRNLFMKTCISCHDRANVSEEGPVWRKMEGLNEQETAGEALYQKNCAFCHARDGTGKNWFGAFLRPHPRNLTGMEMRGMTWGRMKDVISNGLPGTSMSAWKSVLSDEQINAIIAYISRAFHPMQKETETARRAGLGRAAGGG